MPRRTPTATSPVARLAALLTIALALVGCDANRGESPPTPAPAPAVPDASPGAPAGAPFADLAGDTLVAPVAPRLTVTAEAGALVFRRDALSAPNSRERLLEHDARDGGERALDVALPADALETRVPIAAHRLDRHSLSWRLERCDATGCVSSRRVRVEAGTALAAAHEIAPAVVFARERFGDRVAIDAGGTLLAIASPVEGRITLRYLRDDGPAAADPPPRLPGPASTTRALDMALSADGDTIAVLSADTARDERTRLIVFERFGEGWIATADRPAFAAGDGMGGDVATGDDAVRPRVLMAADGERLLAGCTGAPACPLVEHRRSATGWSLGRRLDDGSALDTPLAIAASTTLDRVVVATSRVGATPALLVHDVAGPPPDGATTHRIPLAAFAADAPLALALDAGGTSLVVGGLEPSAAVSPAPILWRYRLASDGTSLALHAEDSLRLAPPPTPADALSLAADATLATIAFGWHTAGVAALTTRLRGDRGWRSALDLPADADALAGRPFGTALALDADGATLALAVPSAIADPTTAPSAGRVLLMRASDRPATLARHPPATIREPRHQR